jgi:hypothetical protein
MLRLLAVMCHFHIMLTSRNSINYKALDIFHIASTLKGPDYGDV